MAVGSRSRLTKSPNFVVLPSFWTTSISRTDAELAAMRVGHSRLFGSVGMCDVCVQPHNCLCLRPRHPFFPRTQATGGAIIGACPREDGRQPPSLPALLPRRWGSRTVFFSEQPRPGTLPPQPAHALLRMHGDVLLAASCHGGPCLCLIAFVSAQHGFGSSRRVLC